VSLKRRHERQQRGARLLSAYDYGLLLGLPPGKRICKCHRIPDPPCESCEAMSEWQEWRASGQEAAVLKLSKAKRPVPNELFPAHFWEQVSE
jgi:hypothetical protein